MPRRQGQGGPGGVDVVSRSGQGPFCAGRPAVAAGAGGRSSQPYLGPRGFGRCPGDKMIDWVSPACGDAAAQSNQAARLALGGWAGGD